MRLFLTSNPFLFEGDRMELNPANGFPALLQESVPAAGKYLLICADPDGWERTDHHAAQDVQAFRDAGFAVSDFTVLDGRNQDQAAKLISEADVVILGGGHVPTQNRFFQKIGLKDLLREYSGVVVGISAGSMNSAGQVYAQPELEGEAVDPDYQRFLPGLGLTSCNILPHYEQWKDDTLDGQRVMDFTARDSRGNSFSTFGRRKLCFCV